jgi:aryl-alcohol dehydrogenase-like predicted oxidoreductase
VNGKINAGTLSIGADRTVNRLGFGAMRITGEGIWGPPEDRPEAIRVLRRAVELGVQLIDTADAYGPGISEELIAEALAPYPSDLVIATKGGLTRPGRHQWTPDGRPSHLREACEASLRRLRLEAIPLYQLHRPDPRVPFAQSVATLAELRAAGKVVHVGLSNVSVAQLQEAQRIVPIVSVQNLYNLVDRTSDDMVDACETAGVVFLPWFPILGGELDSGGAVATVARRHGADGRQVAIAWLLHRSPAIAPIPGTSSVAHLEQNMAAASIDLSREDLDLLDRPSTTR